MSDPWTSLEVTKLVVGAATPVLLAGFGVIVSRSLKRLEDAQWASRKLTERRLDLYDTMAPQLNKLYCFFSAVGDFRSVKPEDAVRLKRELDTAFHVNEFLMSAAFRAAYAAFIRATFQQYAGAGRDALLRSDVRFQSAQRGPEDWSDAWASRFVTEKAEITPISEIRQRYRALMFQFGREVGVVTGAEIQPAVAGHRSGVGRRKGGG